MAWAHAVGDLRGGEEAGCVGVVNGCNEQAAKLVGLPIPDLAGFPFIPSVRRAEKIICKRQRILFAME